MLDKRCLFGSGSGLGCKLGATVHAFQQRKMCTHVKHNLGPPNFCVQTFYKLLPSCCERHIIYTDSHFLPDGARVGAAPLCAACLHLNKESLITLRRPGGDGLQPAVEPPFRLPFACANVYVSVRSAALSPQTPPKTTRARLPACAFTSFNSGEGRRHAEQVQRR